jgi:hypothetical protein
VSHDGRTKTGADYELGCLGHTIIVQGGVSLSVWLVGRRWKNKRVSSQQIKAERMSENAVRGEKE